MIPSESFSTAQFTFKTNEVTRVWDAEIQVHDDKVYLVLNRETHPDLKIPLNADKLQKTDAEGAAPYRYLEPIVLQAGE